MRNRKSVDLRPAQDILRKWRPPAKDEDKWTRRASERIKALELTSQARRDSSTFGSVMGTLPVPERVKQKLDMLRNDPVQRLELAERVMASQAEACVLEERVANYQERIVEQSRPQNREALLRERAAQRDARLQQVAARRAEIRQQKHQQHVALLEAGTHESDKAALDDVLGRVREWDRERFEAPEWLHQSAATARVRRRRSAMDYEAHDTNIDLDVFSSFVPQSGSLSDRGPGASSGPAVHKRRARQLAGMLAHMM